MRRKRWKRAAVITAALTVTVTAAAALDARLKTVHYTINSDKIHAPLRLVFLSDLHDCRYGAGQRRLIDAVRAQKPDAVLMGGDMCDDELHMRDAEPHANTWALLEALAAEYPCFYVTGNHEWRCPEVAEIVARFQAHGVRVLAGEWETVTLGGQDIRVGGVDDPEAPEHLPAHPGFAAQMAAVGEMTESGHLTVLLAHRPERAAEYAALGVDVALAGHAHGGQWRLPGVQGGLFAPNQGLFPRYPGGQYRLGATTLIVGRGLARESTRVPRAFNRPEVVVVDILPEEAWGI